MQNSEALNPLIIAVFVFLILTQALAVSLLPRTEAFTSPGWTAAFAVIMGTSQYSFAWLLHKGTPMGSLVPLMAAVIPLILIAVGIFFYRESASALRVILLVSACGLIGVASAIR